MPSGFGALNCNEPSIDAIRERCYIYAMMYPNHDAFRWCRFAVLLWTASWMLLVPLIHVHPEADHRHGEAGHVHGGTVHTVWSPDLDCEFDYQREHDQSEASSHDVSSGRVQISHAGDAHAEFTVSLLSESSDRKQIHRLMLQALAVTYVTVPDPNSKVWYEKPPDPVPLSIRLLQDLPSRAPPSFLL